MIVTLSVWIWFVFRFAKQPDSCALVRVAHNNNEIKIKTLFMISYTDTWRAQLFVFAYSISFSASAASFALGKRHKKSPHPNPILKWRLSHARNKRYGKQCVLYGHAAHLSRLVSFEFARFSLSDRRYRYRFYAANIRIFHYCKKKNAQLRLKNSTAFRFAKIKDWRETAIKLM